MLNKPQLQPPVETIFGQRKNGGLVHTRHNDRVDFHRRQPGSKGSVDAGQHITVPIPPGEGGILVGVESIKGNIDPVQPGRLQFGGAFIQAQTIRGQRGCHRLTRVGGERGSSGNNGFQTPPKQRLPTGEPHLPDTKHGHRKGDESNRFVVVKRVGAGNPLQAVGRHAISAAKITPVGERHPQVPGDPAESILKPPHPKIIAFFFKKFGGCGP